MTRRSTCARRRSSSTTTSCCARARSAAVAAFSYRVRTPEDLDQRGRVLHRARMPTCDRRADGFVDGASATRCAWSTRSASRTSSSTRPSTSSGCRGAYDLHIAGRARAPRPLQPGHPRRAAGREVHAGSRLPRHGGHPGRGGHRLRRVDAPQAHRARHGDDRRRRTRACTTSRFATHEKHNILAICDKLGALRRSDAIERGPGRHGVSERVLPVPARPRRPPRRDLHAGLLHRRPRQPRGHVGRARQPAPRLVGQPRRARAGTPRRSPRARPRRQSRSPSSPAPTRRRWR